jgi:hypothetical protein
LVKAAIPQGTDYGDAAAFIAFGTGPASGGKVLYIWSTLLSGPQGQPILIDTVSWIVNSKSSPSACAATGSASSVQWLRKSLSPARACRNLLCDDWPQYASGQ